jgi:ubiquinone/menaquinone biosynthesis C-methylase UbiE
MKPQIDKDIYFGPGYLNPGRFASYGYQLSEIVATNPERLLQVGVGNGVVDYMLRQAGLDVTTLDFDPSLEPDVVGSVTDIPFEDNSFETVSCFEVLEHIPWERVPAALSELARVSSRNVLLSLPDRDWVIKAEITLPRIGRRNVSLSLKRRTKRQHQFDGEHYWEIGLEHVTLDLVVKEFETAGLQLKDTFRNEFCVWHRFFRLEKRTQ